jgi:hypothetical protein
LTDLGEQASLPAMAPRASVLETTAPANRDPLAEYFARRRIDRAQYEAGREFRKHHTLAENGQVNAAEWLTKIFRELGQNGSAIISDVLIRGMSIRQIAEARDMVGEERFLARRLFECLHALALLYGFANGGSVAQRQR